MSKINFLDYVLMYIFNLTFLITTIKTALQTNQKEIGRLFLKTPAEKRKTIDPTVVRDNRTEEASFSFMESEKNS